MAQRKDNRLNGINPLSYLGVVPVSPSDSASYQRPPTANDRKNFNVGDVWVDQSSTPNPDAWMLVKLAANVATWIKLAEGSSSGEQFVTDSGTALPSSGILNVLGDGGPMLTSGTGNTVTITTDGTLASIFQTDTLFCQPVAGTLEITGGPSVSTVGSGNVLTINLDADVATTYAADVGTAAAAANVITIAGGSSVSTSAAGSTITITSSGGGGGAANASFLAHQVADGGNASVGVLLGAAVAMTEVYDVGTNFTIGDGAGVSAKFTAPQNGKYLLQMQVRFVITAGAASGSSDSYVELQTSNRTYRDEDYVALSGGVSISTEQTSKITVVADMDAADTAEFYGFITAGPTHGIQGDTAGTGEYNTFVSGTLVDTDTTSYTQHAVLVGDATGDIGELALATDGQVLIGATGAASAWANISAGANITINEGPNTLEIVSTGGGLGSSVASFLAFLPTDDPSGGIGRRGGLGMDTVLTEIYDIGANFYPGDGAGTAATFTAPQTGKYQINYAVLVNYQIWLETSNRTYYFIPSAYSVRNLTVVADMDIGDTAEFGYGRGFFGAAGVLSGKTGIYAFLNGSYQTYVSGTLV